MNTKKTLVGITTFDKNGFAIRNVAVDGEQDGDKILIDVPTFFEEEKTFQITSLGHMDVRVEISKKKKSKK